MTEFRKHDLYICNLSPVTTKDDLIAHFTSKGFPLVFAWMIKRDRKTGVMLGRPFAHAKLEVPADQDRCVAALNGTEFHGRVIYVKPYRNFPAMRDELLPRSKAHAQAIAKVRRVAFKSEPHPTWRGSTWQREAEAQ